MTDINQITPTRTKQAYLKPDKTSVRLKKKPRAICFRIDLGVEVLILAIGISTTIKVLQQITISLSLLLSTTTWRITMWAVSNLQRATNMISDKTSTRTTTKLMSYWEIDRAASRWFKPHLINPHDKIKITTHLQAEMQSQDCLRLLDLED